MLGRAGVGGSTTIICRATGKGLTKVKQDFLLESYACTLIPLYLGHGSFKKDI
jgi:hypothetical protein